jgi:hypothetical protein
MSVCINLVLDRFSCLGAYGGYVVLRTRNRAQRASMRTRDRRSPYLHRIVPMSVCADVGPDRPSRFAAYTGHVIVCAHLRCTLALADFLSSWHRPNECLCEF